MSATAAPALPPQNGLPGARRAWAMITLCLGVMLSTLDGAIANIALPTISADLHTSPATTVWVVSAYQLAVTIAILPLAMIGESIGYRRVYLSGVAVFTVASLGCALSTQLDTLVAGRVLQGLSGAALVGVSAALLRYIFPREQLGRGMAFYTLSVAVALSAGPSVAAGILSVASWPWLFAVNVPAGIIGLLIGMRALPRARGTPRRFDTGGAVLNALCLGLLVVGVDTLGNGLAHPAGWLMLGGSLLTGIWLVRQQRRRAVPLVPVDLLRIPMFALSATTSVCSYVAQTSAFVALPFYFQNVLGRGQVETGLLVTPWPLIVVGIAPLAGYLSDKVSAGILCSIGLATMATGLLLLVMLPAHPTDWNIAWRMVVCGSGFGFFQTPNNRAIMVSAPMRRTGAASGSMATVRLLGQALGAALTAVALGLVPAGTPGLGATGIALSIGAVVAALGAVTSVSRLRAG